MPARISIGWLLMLTYGAAGQLTATPAEIQTVQEALAERGYDTGGADGRLGAKTATAISQYQSDWRLNETGEISRELIDRLTRVHPSTEPQWLELEAGGCIVWNGNPQARETAEWSGVCSGGKVQGPGKMTWRYVLAGKPATETYEGEYRDGKFNGSGTVNFANGTNYQGEFRDGEFDGRGLLIFAEGWRYEGEFRNGKFDGLGVITFPDGGGYEGEFRDDEFNGRGVLTFGGIGRYEGEFRDDQYNGQGIFEWSNGNRFEGEYRDDRPNGFGTYTNGGVEYSGTWKNGCLSTGSKNLAVHTTMEACGF